MYRKKHLVIAPWALRLRLMALIAVRIKYRLDLLINSPPSMMTYWVYKYKINIDPQEINRRSL